MEGGPRVGNVISTKGNARALHFSPFSVHFHYIFTPLGPGFDRANFHVIVQMRPGLGPVLGFSLSLYFRHPSISDENEKNCRAGGNNMRPCRDCQELLDGV